MKRLGNLLKDFAAGMLAGLDAERTGAKTWRGNVRLAT
jgi:hypothetical protein